MFKKSKKSQGSTELLVLISFVLVCAIVYLAFFSDSASIMRPFRSDGHEAWKRAEVGIGALYVYPDKTKILVINNQRAPIDIVSIVADEQNLAVSTANLPAGEVILLNSSTSLDSPDPTMLITYRFSSSSRTFEVDCDLIPYSGKPMS